MKAAPGGLLASRGFDVPPAGPWPVPSRGDWPQASPQWRRYGERQPFQAVERAVRDGGFEEVIISTLPTRVSKWLRRDLIRRVEGLGLPVTAIVPREAGDSSVDATLQAMKSQETWAPKGPRSPGPRIGEEHPRGE